MFNVHSEVKYLRASFEKKTDILKPWKLFIYSNVQRKNEGSKNDDIHLIIKFLPTLNSFSSA